MSDQKAAQSLHNLGAALERLQEALQEPEENPLAIWHYRWHHPAL